MRVVAAAPIERIVEFIAGDELGAVRAGDILDAPQHIGFNDYGLNDAAGDAGRPRARVAAVGRAEPEADNIWSHNRNVIRVVTEVAGGIDTRAADQHIAAEAAIERVITAAPIEPVRKFVAEDLVATRRCPDDILDADQRIDRNLRNDRPARRGYETKLGP